MKDRAHGLRLGIPADEAGSVVLRQPPASKLANLCSSGFFGFFVTLVSEGSRGCKIRKVVVIGGFLWERLALLLGPGRSGARHGFGQVFVVGALGFGLTWRLFLAGGGWNGVEVVGGGGLGLRLGLAASGSARPR